MNDIAKAQSWYVNCVDCLEARYDNGLKIWYAQEQDPDDGADRLPWCREDDVVNQILHARAGEKIAVIVNEFGEAGIDGQLVVGAEEEILEPNNGCICCTVRGDRLARSTTSWRGGARSIAS